MGNSLLTSVQYGGETTRGTGVAATKILSGLAPGSLKIGQDVKPKFISEQLGVRASSRRVKNYQKLYKNSFDIPDASFQQLLFPFSCGLKGSITPTETTPSQADYLWAFLPSMTALNNPEAATIEMYDEVQCWEVNYSMVEKISIKGSIDQDGGDASVGLSFDWFGRQLVKTTKTAALSVSAGELMNAKLARLYYDTAWAGVGGTELSNLLRSFQIDIMTGVHPDSTGGADNTFNQHKEGELAIAASFTIEAGTSAVALHDALRAETFGVFRLSILGSQIGTGTTHSLKIDIGGFLETVGPIDGEDRTDNLATFAMKGTYDPTGAKLFDVNVTTNTNAWK